MPYIHPLDKIRTQVWLEFLLEDLSMTADELELDIHPYKREASRSISRWLNGTCIPNKSSVKRVNQKYPQGHKIYDLVIWKILDDRETKISDFLETSFAIRITEESFSEPKFSREFIQAAYDLRIAEFKNDAYKHYCKMEQCLTLFPFYFSKKIFVKHASELGYLLYQNSWCIPATESRIIPNYELLTDYSENPTEYDLEHSEKPFTYLVDYMRPAHPHKF